MWTVAIETDAIADTLVIAHSRHYCLVLQCCDTELEADAIADLASRGAAALAVEAERAELEILDQRHAHVLLLADLYDTAFTCVRSCTRAHTRAHERIRSNATEVAQQTSHATSQLTPRMIIFQLATIPCAHIQCISAHVRTRVHASAHAIQRACGGVSLAAVLRTCFIAFGIGD